MIAISSPFLAFRDLSGQPLDGGYLYFGQPNQNPETAPITVYWDEAGTQPAAQPIRTSNGYAMRAGTPAKLYVSGLCSITVRDRNRRLVYPAPMAIDAGMNFPSVSGKALNFLRVKADETGYELRTPVQARSDIGAGVFPCVRNLTGNVNSTTPLTSFDLTCDFVVLRDTNGSTVTLYGPHPRTVDLGLAGPIVGGRDQLAAFPANSWVHIYYIWNGATLGLTASLSPPINGPALQSGYTYWSYATTIRKDASGNIIPGYVRGAGFFFEVSEGVTRVLTAGAATSFQTLNCSAFVPPNAYSAMVGLTIGINHTTGGVLFTLHRRVTGSGAASGVKIGSIRSVGTQIVDAFNIATIPLDGSCQFDYRMNAAPAGGGAYIDILAYIVPNGDA